MTLNVAWVSHKEADYETSQKAMQYMEQWLPVDAFTITDQHPDIVLFMSGGSERHALGIIQPERPVLLISINGHNAYASATEVMAWMVSHGRFAILSDGEQAFRNGLLTKWQQVVTVWNSLYGKRAGLIGRVSDWLVASVVPAERLRRQFGVSLEEIPWSQMPDFKSMQPDQTLINRFQQHPVQGLDQAAQVLTMLRQVVLKNRLHVLAVECFSLVRHREVTACLALAQLNAEGVVAACEGDLASMAGMMLLEALTGEVPWMANTTRITQHSLHLSHCTISFPLVEGVTLTTHYETNRSLAIRGEYTAREVTLFRLSGPLDKAFVAEGVITSHPALTEACRTQVEIDLPPEALHLLRTQPLGNHLIMARGHHADVIEMACHYRGIKIIM